MMGLTEDLVLKVGVVTLDRPEMLVIPALLVLLASLELPESKVHLDLG